MSLNNNSSYRVYYIHQNGTVEGEKSFAREDDANLYAKKLAGAESSDISLMEWDEQKKELEAILDIPIRCSQDEFLKYLSGIGISEEEMQSKIDSYNDISNCGNCAVIESPDGNRAYRWELAFDFKDGLHYALAYY